MRDVTVADLKAIASGPAPLAASLVGPINRHAPAHGIDTPLLMAHFLCHICHETGGFKTMVESLNYSVSGLLKTFSRRRISKADAERLGRKPKEGPLSEDRQRKIANLIYGGAWGRENLGNTGPDDGWRFRGGGPPMLTGRDNYERFGKAAGVDLLANPDLVRDPDAGIEIAAKFFQARMRSFALKDDIVGETRALNGGSLGLDDRQAALARGKRVLGVGSARPLGLMAHADTAIEPVDGISDAKTIRLVQEMLRNLGYAEVGTPNGQIGPFTRTAVRAFRAENGLPDGEHIDDALVAALVRAEPRKLPESRTGATPAEVRDKVPEAKATWRGKIGALWTAGLSGVGAAFSGALDYLGDAKGYLEPVKEFAGDVPGWVWFVAIGVGAFFLSRTLQKGEAASVQAFQQGARR